MRRESSSAVRIVMSSVTAFDRLIGRARGVPNLIPNPRGSRRQLDDALFPRRLLIGKKKKKIDIRSRREQSAGPSRPSRQAPFARQQRDAAR